MCYRQYNPRESKIKITTPSIYIAVSFIIFLLLKINSNSQTEININLESEQSLEGTLIYFNHGDGFSENQKYEIKNNIKKFNLSFRKNKNIKQLRIDPIVDQIKINSLRINQKNDTFKFSFEQNGNYDNNVFKVNNFDDPYIVFDSIDFKSNFEINFKYLFIISLLIYCLIILLENFFRVKNIR
jgi:hypothetical protein